MADACLTGFGELVPAGQDAVRLRRGDAVADQQLPVNEGVRPGVEDDSKEGREQTVPMTRRAALIERARQQEQQQQ